MGGATTDPEDPEMARVRELAQYQVEGTATEAHREELAMYLADRPDLREIIEASSRQAGLGEGWLARVRKDDAIAVVEGSARTRVERMTGAGLMLAGFALSMATGWGAAVSGMGLLLVLYSFARVRLAAHANDPYKDVVE